MRRISVIFLMAITLILISAASAFGQAGGGLAIPIDTWIEAPTGTLVPLADVETPRDLVGAICTELAVAENGTSVHPNNDIIIETGGTSTVLRDVEGSSGKTTSTAGEITLGDRVVLTLLMGDHGQFSGGLVVRIGENCTPTTTTTTTTTTMPLVVAPMIEIDKYAPTTDDPKSEWGYYGSDGVGTFSITVHNNGPVPLTDVTVTDELLGVGDRSAECGKLVGGLAVDESVSFTCTIAGLDYANGVIYTNEATVVGFGPNRELVTDKDPATVSAVKDVIVTTTTTTTTTTLAPPATQAPGTSAPAETLPKTGASTEQLRGLGIAGIALVLAGIAMLGGATLIGQYRKEN